MVMVSIGVFRDDRHQLALQVFLQLNKWHNAENAPYFRFTPTDGNVSEVTAMHLFGDKSSHLGSRIASTQSINRIDRWQHPSSTSRTHGQIPAQISKTFDGDVRNKKNP